MQYRSLEIYSCSVERQRPASKITEQDSLVRTAEGRVQSAVHSYSALVNLRIALLHPFSPWTKVRRWSRRKEALRGSQSQSTWPAK